MKNFSVVEARKKIVAYLGSADKIPYFVAADGGEYRDLKNKLTELSTIRVGSFCFGDTFPNFDGLCDALKNFDSNALCLGLGEAVLLSGNVRIVEKIRELYCKKKIIVLCRGVKNILRSIAERSPKFRRTLCFVDSAESFSVVQYLPELKAEVDAKNFGELLTLLEDGKCGEISVQSELKLQNVRLLATAYDAIKFRKPNFTAPQKVLNAEQWNEFLQDNSTEENNPAYWRYYLRGFIGGLGNRYLKFVFDRSANFDEYARNIFFALLELDKDDKNFREFYALRKELVKNFNEKILNEYISTARVKGADAVYYLTDNTKPEICAAIEAVQGLRKIPDALLENFPTIEKYLGEYKFADGRLTDYFRRYKKIKLCNVEDAEFKADVDNFARARIYTELETRQTILDRLDKNAKLYWLDALGVEFLNYINQVAIDLNLAIKIHVARAELPTLTAVNKNFYDDWQGDKFPKNGELDELKHTDKNSAAPLYIFDEFSIIDAVLKDIQNSLQTGDDDKIILTSDHGASRLAVIYRGENFAMTNAGEHGGRCCKIDERDVKPPCAAEANGYFIAANYDRFKGGRLDGVEVHGGATLEEVLVPIVEISLAEEKIPIETEEKPSALNDKDDSFDFFD